MDQIDQYLRVHQGLHPTAQLTDFKENPDGKYIVQYLDGPSMQKYIVKETIEGDLQVIFMESVYSMTTSMIGHGPHPKVINFDSSFQLPVILNPSETVSILKPQHKPEASPYFNEDHEKNKIEEMIARFQETQHQLLMPGLRKEVNKEEINDLLLERLPFLEGGQLLSIEKEGWKRGVLLNILYDKQGKLYQINAKYRYLIHKLQIQRVDEVVEQPFDFGKKLINSFITEIFERDADYKQTLPSTEKSQKPELFQQEQEERENQKISVPIQIENQEHKKLQSKKPVLHPATFFNDFNNIKKQAGQDDLSEQEIEELIENDRQNSLKIQ